jgi:hypothetical protein
LVFLAWFAKTEFTAIPTRRILHIGNACTAPFIPELAAHAPFNLVPELLMRLADAKPAQRPPIAQNLVAATPC